MATKAQREEIAAKTDLVRRLTVSGDTGAAAAVARDAEDLIRKTRPIREHDGYLALLKRAKSATGLAVTSLEDLDAPTRHDVEELQLVGVKRIREGVEQGLKLGDYARQVAEILLDTRLRMRNRAGLPDLLATSKLTKNLAHDMYARAAEDVREDDEDRVAAHRSVSKAVRNRMSDVLVTYLRALDDNRSEAQNYFGRALATYPDDSPTEAVYKLYESEGFKLPRRSRTEAQSALNRARAAQFSNATPATLDDEYAELDRVRSTFTGVVSRASSLTARERSGLKSRIQETITTLAAEAAKL